MSPRDMSPPSWVRLPEVIRDWRDVGLSVFSIELFIFMSNECPFQHDHSSQPVLLRPQPSPLLLTRKAHVQLRTSSSSCLQSVPPLVFLHATRIKGTGIRDPSTVQIPRRAKHNHFSTTQCLELVETFRPSHSAATRVPDQTLETGTTSVVVLTPGEQEEAAPSPGLHPTTFLLRPTSRKVWTRPKSSKRSHCLRVCPRPSTSRSRTRAMSRRTIGPMRRSLRSSFQVRVFAPA